ncbi:MAG: FecR domain-containing protein [Phaeodactylibacter sp.]|nr:FecR domain-containing protein [Phaeodactylibacter sp.]
MTEQERHSYFLDLASKYLSGNATDSEVRELEDWVSADAANRETFMAVKKAWMLTGGQSGQSAVDVDGWWAKTESELFESAKVVPLESRKGSRRWLSVAASITVVAVVAALLYLQPWSGEWMMAEADADSSKKVELADGSEVVLNRSASLSYAYQPRSAVRRVELKGDAYFDVAKDPKNPFIIQCRMVEIEVLGTSFYVDAREEQDEVQVIVKSGRVAVRHQQQERILGAGEMAVFSVTGNRLDTLRPPDDNYQALKTNTLAFEATRLTDVVFALNRYYHANIRIESAALQDCLFSSTFTDKSLDTVLKVLEASFELTVRRENGLILLTGTCGE